MLLGFLKLKAVRENRERRRPVKEEYGLIFDGSPTPRDNTDPDKSVLMRAGEKLDHPETYAGSSDLEEFEVFIAGILRCVKVGIS